MVSAAVSEGGVVCTSPTTLCAPRNSTWELARFGGASGHRNSILVEIYGDEGDGDKAKHQKQPAPSRDAITTERAKRKGHQKYGVPPYCSLQDSPSGSQTRYLSDKSSENYRILNHHSQPTISTYKHKE
eukprot:GHVU01103015.1.p1 GENE.GHVU01103015.1~~GHVU01103015.1.p1  ORF type:complete len:151 (-),score=7.80 GHVU01103015.1:88-474(-)